MVDLNGIADMTKRINETLARHGMDEKKTYPSYEAPTPTAAAGRPAYNGRLSDNRYHSSRESRDREIVTATPTGKYIMSTFISLLSFPLLLENIKVISKKNL